MSKKLILISVVIGIIFIIVKIIPLLGSDAEKIRKVVLQAQSAVEKKNLLKAISCVSMDYHDRHGNSRGDLFVIGQNVFTSYNDLLIIIEDMKIEVKDESSATARVIASGQGRRTEGGKLEYLLDTDRVKVNINLKKEEEGWKIVELDFIEPQDFMQFLKGL